MRVRLRRAWILVALVAAPIAGELVFAPAASAVGGRSLVPVGLFGLPSLHSIIQAIAKGFFGALAGALVPSWLKHGTVSTIQHLVALPDPATWTHVSQLQGDMTYLAAMLLPVTLAVGAVRYWLVGLTGAAHPASALVRCTGVTGVLVGYRWIVEQTVAGTNTLTHGILGLPAIGNGLQRIIGVLFGGALLSGGGGVFGAFLVIIGVIFAAGLFAAQVLLTLVLALLIVAGPPLIAISAIPELSHLSRSWAHALLSVALVPLGWTVLFATAGALCLDATSFTGAGGGLPGHVAAALAGLITFVIAARLPLMVVGEIRHLFSGHGLGGARTSGVPSGAVGTERVRAAHSRLRAVGLEGVPSLGRSVGRAAGALGTPNGGPIGAAGRGLAGAARRAGVFSAAAAARGGATGALTAAGAPRNRGSGGGHGVKARLAEARSILTSAPAEAMTAVNVASGRTRSGKAGRASAQRTGAVDAAGPGGSAVRGRVTPSTQASTRASDATRGARLRGTAGKPGNGAGGARVPVSRASVGLRASPVSATAPTVARASDVSRAASGHGSPLPPRPAEIDPAAKRAQSTRQARATSPQPGRARSDSSEKSLARARRASSQAPRSQPPVTPPRTPPQAPSPKRQARGGAPKRRPSPRSRP
jgi:hypothetical protein